MQTKAHQQIQLLADYAEHEKRMSDFYAMMEILNRYGNWVDKVKIFHETFGLPVRDGLTDLSVSDRYRRLMLTFEEFCETVEASGFRFTVTMSDGSELDIHDMGSIRLKHIEGSRQNLALIADGIGDQLVTNIGHALEHGFPIAEVFLEIMCSNMTKLDENGKPIVNRCVDPECQAARSEAAILSNGCETQSHMMDSSKPKGKILKPSTYVPADVAAILEGAMKDE